MSAGQKLQRPMVRGCPQTGVRDLMSKVFIVDLEAVETRYTGQWKTHIPDLLRKENCHVEVIAGPEDIPKATTPGAFLNFGGTNIYKSRQIEQIGRLFCSGSVSAGDHFLFTDAWHPGIINLKYMSELLGIPVKIHAMWHAGSYDPQDFLGRLIGDTPWVRHAEKSFYHAIDHNYFATEFHIEMFCKNLLGYENSSIVRQFAPAKIIRTGWPFENLEQVIKQDVVDGTKRNLILFPHRLAPEKQVEIFRDLAGSMPEYDWVICQEQALTKQQYHRMLGEAKLVFSANLQETLGISMYEGLCAGAAALVPRRLSYTEQYHTPFVYPSSWTESWAKYQNHKQELASTIKNLMDNLHKEEYIEQIHAQQQHLTQNFFSATMLYRNLIK
jgi:hypothetical protein